MHSNSELHAELLSLLDKQLEILELSVFVTLTDAEQVEFQAGRDRINELFERLTLRAVA